MATWRNQYCDSDSEDDFKKYTCDLCLCTNDDSNHLNTLEHRTNFLLHEWNYYRKGLVKNRNGIVITQRVVNHLETKENYDFDERKGKYTLKMTREEYDNLQDVGLLFRITVRNDQLEKNILLIKASTLTPDDHHFSMSDSKGIVGTERVLEIPPKRNYDFDVHCKLSGSTIGTFDIPIAFSFQKHFMMYNPLLGEDTEERIEAFTVARHIVVDISDDHNEEELPKESPYKSILWDESQIKIYIPTTGRQHVSEDYPIPERYKRVFQLGMKKHNKLNPDEENYRVNKFEVLRLVENEFTMRHYYADYYHVLLWLEETAQQLMVQRFNMSCIQMKVVESSMLELEVPGLAEKRPSLIVGDLLMIRVHQDHTVYNGVVKQIHDKVIWIHEIHQDLVDYIRDNPTIELDVTFKIGRLSFERMHKAVDNCARKQMFNLLFPDDFQHTRTVIPMYRIQKYFDETVASNKEQKTVVNNILNRTSQGAPYVVFGPPGTGKTVTIIEAILQIKAHVRNCKILVCAPANAACDMLTSKLAKHCNKNELIRIHAGQRDWSTIPDEVKGYSNHNGKEYVFLNDNTINKYTIVVTTLILIGKFKKYMPNYVFIDEAAQAMEPEVDIAISLMNSDGQLVLAGDPRQLGPYCGSKVAAKYKLDQSLLERLMKKNKLYKLPGNSNYITMLTQNYRSHRTILSIANKLFYEEQLEAVNPQPQNDPIANILIYPLAMKNNKQFQGGKERSIEFCAVNAKEQRQGKSPSYYNQQEIQMVMKYMETLLSLNVKVNQSEIGIITPYVRQMQRIRWNLDSRNYKNVEVGTTEVFQGREKRIIIISTVRGQTSLLLYDRKYQLGFVANKKRMNVAITRAMSKLIVVGNPVVLSTDKYWLEYIEFCEKNKTYFGPQYVKRTDDTRKKIQKKFEKVEIKNQNPTPTKGTTVRTRNRRGDRN